MISISDIKPPSKVFLPNEGYIVGELPQDLYNNLLNEGLGCEKRNKSRITGLITVDGDHRIVLKNKPDLKKQIAKAQEITGL